MTDLAEAGKLFNEMLRSAGSICILGHTGPDGDSIGSTLAIYNYIRNMRGDSFDPEDVKVYLETCSEKFSYLSGFRSIVHEAAEDRTYDLAVVCDCADETRPKLFTGYLKKAAATFLIDHHFTNTGFCSPNVILPQTSSTCEIVFELMEPEYIDRKVAECIYTGIIHDTGVFRYRTTSARTMEIAGLCMEKGIDFPSIIDDSFFSMTLVQKAALGHVLESLRSDFEGRLVYGILERKTMRSLGLTTRDVDGIIDSVRTTRGAVAVYFMYAAGTDTYKISLRSNSESFDVSGIAAKFGGGGHRMAAGCTMGNDVEANTELLREEFSRLLEPAVYGTEKTDADE